MPLSVRQRRKPVTPIIVGGCLRSGTSLLRRLLNAHSRIHCGPEVKFFRDFYGDYLHDPLRHLRFAASARTMLDEDALLELLGQAFVSLHERAASNDGKRRWADKNPENVRYLPQWQRLLGREWHFVQILRNPLDTLASIAEAGFPLTIPAALDERVSLYLEYTQSGLSFAMEHPDRSYLLAYERLVSEPAETVGHLMEWLGEDFEEGQLRFNDFYHQPGLEDPKVSVTSSILGSRVGRWRTVFGQAEAEYILERTQAIWDVIDRQHRLGEPSQIAIRW